MKLKGGIFMKFMKGLTVGILIGILLTGSAFAAVQYNLSESEWKVVVDGQPVQDERYPVLLLPPGYNYMAVGSLRSVCEKAGIPFEADVPTKEVRITTKEEKIVSTETVSATPDNQPITEPYTLIRDGVKKAFMGDINKILKPYGYSLASSGKSDWTLILRNKDGLLFDNIKYTTHEYNGNPAAFIDYDFYEQNIKPLITN
jgi:hypothetical protein